MTVSTETENYSQPANRVLPAGVSFLTDWANLQRAGGFKAIQAMDTCRIQFDPNFKTWHGLAATRVEVNPGDDPISSGGERSEVLFPQTVSGSPIYESSASGTQYIAVSYFFPSNFDGTWLSGNSNSWSIVMQLHNGGGSGVFSALMAGKRTASGKHTFTYASAQTYPFSDGGEIRRGEWVDFIFELNFANGRFKIYRRNETQSNFTVVVDATDPSMVSTGQSYMKQGLYRGSSVNGRTDVIWMGPTARGTSFSAVEQAAFATTNGP